MSRLYKNNAVCIGDTSRAIPVTLRRPERETGGERPPAAAPVVRVIAEPPKPSAQELAQQTLAAANAEAQEILEYARAEAQKVKEEALAQAHKELKNAAKIGFEAGAEAGRAEYGRAAEKFAADLSGLCQSIRAAQEQMIDEYVSEIHELILSLARRVIGREIDRDDEVFLTMFKEAIEQIRSNEWIALRVSGHNIEIPVRNRAKLEEMILGASELRIVEDRKEGEHRFIIETPDTIVDFSVDTQLARLQEIIEQIQFDERAFDERRLSFGKTR